MVLSSNNPENLSEVISSWRNHFTNVYSPENGESIPMPRSPSHKSSLMMKTISKKLCCQSLSRRVSFKTRSQHQVLLAWSELMSWSWKRTSHLRNHASVSRHGSILMRQPTHLSHPSKRGNSKIIDVKTAHENSNLLKERQNIGNILATLLSILTYTNQNTNLFKVYSLLVTLCFEREVTPLVCWHSALMSILTIFESRYTKQLTCESFLLLHWVMKKHSC